MCIFIQLSAFPKCLLCLAPSLGPRKTDSHGHINCAHRSSQLCRERGEDVGSDEPYARWKYKGWLGG